MKWIRMLGAVFALLSIMFWTVSISILIMVCYLLQWLIPFKKIRHFYRYYFVYQLINIWINLVGFSTQLGMFGRWHLPKRDTLNFNQHYLVISNHRSWFDIIAVAFALRNRTPPFRFFMKRELLWQLPVAGIMCWMVGFPFMRRHTRAQIRKKPQLRNADVNTTKAACQRFATDPITFINFPEGTRFTPKKAERQASPFNHLLKPNAGGCSMVLSELSNVMTHILHVTVFYSDSQPTFWQLLSGQVRNVQVEFNIEKVTPDLIGDYYKDRTYRKHFQQWLNQKWSEKDTRLTQLFAAEELSS